MIDIARTSRCDGLIAADAALREQLTSTVELEATASSCVGWPGITDARWVIDRADSLAESALESFTRACLLERGVPGPVLQAQIRDPGDG